MDYQTLFTLALLLGFLLAGLLFCVVGVIICLRWLMGCGKGKSPIERLLEQAEALAEQALDEAKAEQQE